MVPILAACGMCGHAQAPQTPIWEPGSTGVIHRVSIPVAEGNHRVSVTLGKLDAPTTTTIKAELRRLVLEGIVTAAGVVVSGELLRNVFHGDYAQIGRVTSLIYIAGMIVILLAPDTSKRSLKE